jgi:aminoglycoside phosphotransferase family enzyme
VESAAGSSVERRETHISIVFLVGQSAYKMKRQVVYPYLNFPTSERRRDLCVREVPINFWHSAGVYQAIVLVACSQYGELALDGDGEPVD